MATRKDYALFCLENPLLDIVGFGNESTLKQYNLKANDAILADESHMGLYADLLDNYNAQFVAGGAAQNTARGAQYMLPPNSTVYVGCVGNDKYASILREAVDKAGLRVEYRVDETHPTGRCGVVVTGHNRSMCTDLGAANHYTLDHLQQPHVWELAQGAEVIYIGGYHFTVCPPAIMALAEEAAQGNKAFVLSLSAPFIPQFFKEPLDASAPYWDYVIGNETEAEAYSQSHEWGITDLKEIAVRLAELPKKNKKRDRVAIITHGTEPTIVAVAGKGIMEFPVRVVDSSEINDTTGAGDAFAGGFVAGLVDGKSLAECVDMGQWLASLTIKELGPQFPFPKQIYKPSTSK